MDWSRRGAFLVWVAILAAAVRLVGGLAGGELGAVVTGWFKSL